MVAEVSHSQRTVSLSIHSSQKCKYSLPRVRERSEKSIYMPQKCRRGWQRLWWAFLYEEMWSCQAGGTRGRFQSRTQGFGPNPLPSPLFQRVSHRCRWRKGSEMEKKKKKRGGVCGQINLRSSRLNEVPQDSPEPLQFTSFCCNITSALVYILVLLNVQ